MLNFKFINNQIIVRTLYAVNNPYFINKPKDIKSLKASASHPLKSSKNARDKVFTMNTRLITVEGNLGVGKEKLAKKIAEYFDLKYTGDFNEEDLYVYPYGRNKVNFAKYNDLLPPSSRIYTRQMFWNDQNPIKNGKPLLLQLHHYYWRFFNCCKNMHSMFHYGQGIVTKRSPWSDNVMALTLKECGLMSEKAYKIYNLVRCESLPSLWKPHFIVYIKSKPEVVRQKIKEKNDWTSQSRNISDKFIETYQDVMENMYLKNEEKFSRVLTIDTDEHNIDNDDDFHFLMESLAKLNVDYDDIDEFDTTFYDWKVGTFNSHLFRYYRQYFSSANLCFMSVIPVMRIPQAMSEGAYSETDLDRIHAIVDRDERMATDAWYNPKWESWKDILFKMPSFNYNYVENQPFALMTRAYQ